MARLAHSIARHLTLLAAAGGVIGVAAMAQAAQITPPAGCEAFLTVQSRGCMVSHYWTCEGDAAGEHWRLSLDVDGPMSLSHTDREFRWLESLDLRTGLRSRLVQPEIDPASLSELLETGRDSFTFSLSVSEGDAPFTRDYSGFDALMGDTVEIDGEVLARTEFAYTETTPDGTRSTVGNQYVSPSLRMFFGGTETLTLPGGEEISYDASPVDFARPNEAGFLNALPLYDCGDVLS